MTLTEHYLIERDIIMLRKAVGKWAKISVGLSMDHGGENCALCFYYGYGCEKDEIRCPVYNETRDISCDDSPYELWVNHLEREHNEYWIKYGKHEIQCGECRTIANKELMFLQRLLEEYKEKLICRD
jgi:hypothetical protein